MTLLMEVHKQTLSFSPNRKFQSLYYFSQVSSSFILFSNKKHCKTHKKIITCLQSLQKVYPLEVSQISGFIYYFFSPYNKHGYLGQTLNLSTRFQNHFSQAKKQNPSLLLYKTIQNIGIEKFSLYAIQIPSHLLLFYETFLIFLFKPSLNEKINTTIPVPFKNAHFLLQNIQININSNLIHSSLRNPVLLPKNQHIMKPCNIYTRKQLSSPDLLYLFKDIYTNKPLPLEISISYGNIDYTNWNLVVFILHKSIFKNPAKEPITLTQIQKMIKNKNITSFTITPSFFLPLTNDYLLVTILPKIAKGSLKPKTVFRNHHPLYLFNAYYLCSRLGKENQTASARSKISEYCKTIFNLRPANKIQLRTLDTPLLRRLEIKKLQKLIIQNLDIDSLTQTLLTTQSSVTLIANKKLKHSLHNHITWCKNWNSEHTPTCSCTYLSKVLKAPLNQDNHISCFGSDIKSQPYKKILTCNANNVCIPSLHLIQKNFLSDLHTYIADLLDFTQKISNYNYNPPTIPTITGTPLQRLSVTLQHFTKPNQPFTYHLLRKLENEHVLYHKEDSTPTAILPTSDQANLIRNQLKNSLIISSPDKNSGIFDCCCPTIFWNHMKSQYWENTEHFKKLDISPKQFITSCKDSYQKNDWKSFGKIPNRSQPPYVYIVRKFKDTSRIRGITSYYHHPLKKVYHTSASGLMTVLKNIPFAHGNLFSTKEFLPYLKDSYSNIKNSYGKDTTIMTWAADIKEMYDWLLPQNIIITAIKHILQHVQKSSRRFWVSVNIPTPKKSHLGKSHHEKTQINISFEKIFQISCYEIENAIFILNNKLFLQLMGIPIRAIGSPAYCMAFCIFQENFFFDSIYDYQIVFKFFRYFDDLRAILAFSNSDKKSKKLAHKFIDRLAKYAIINPLR